MIRSVISAVTVLAASVSVVLAQAPAPVPPPAPAPAPAPAATSAPDLAAGEQSFKKCNFCHRIGVGAKTLVGPELNGLDGRPAGSVVGFNYSDANKNSGITWGEATFKDYITDPRAKIPGTKMIFAGIKSETERNNLWGYLKQFSADGTIKK